MLGISWKRPTRKVKVEFRSFIAEFALGNSKFDFNFSRRTFPAYSKHKKPPLVVLERSLPSFIRTQKFP